jgi:hypothetical protein
VTAPRTVSERERLAAIWSAFGCAPNPDDFKESVRERMWEQVLSMARESAAQSSRVYRENLTLEAEVRRLLQEISDRDGEHGELHG